MKEEIRNKYRQVYCGSVRVLLARVEKRTRIGILLETLQQQGQSRPGVVASECSRREKSRLGPKQIRSGSLAKLCWEEILDATPDVLHHLQEKSVQLVL
jgi:hypothetical protein